MSRFVLVSFFFMGWSFYELSGGSDFVPPQRPDPVAVAKAKPIAEPRVTAASLVPKPLLQPVQQPVLLPRNNKITASLPDRPIADPELRSEVALAQITAVGDTFEFGVRVGTSAPIEPQIQMASLSGGLGSLTEPEKLPVTDVQPVLPPVPDLDLRHVTASRVNMRGGPSTIYPVVTKLSHDTAVEVLEDSGTGWLHLRVVDGDQTGWIAASLISKKRP